MARRVGESRLYGNGEKVRTVPIKPKLCGVLAAWIEERRAARR